MAAITPYDKLEEAVNAAGRVYRAAADDLYRAEARLLQHTLLALAEAHPGIVTFSFEVSSEYNDEGGYYDSVMIRQDGATDGEMDAEEPLWEVTDYGWSAEAVALCFNHAEDAREAAITVEALRALEL